MKLSEFINELQQLKKQMGDPTVYVVEREGGTIDLYTPRLVANADEIYINLGKLEEFGLEVEE